MRIRSALPLSILFFVCCQTAQQESAPIVARPGATTENTIQLERKNDEVILEASYAEILDAISQMQESKAENRCVAGVAAKMIRLDDTSVTLRAVLTLEDKRSGCRDIGEIWYELGKNIPESVWLDEVKISGNELFIAGYSVDEADVAAFAQNLREKHFVDHVNIVIPEENETTKSVPAKRFSIVTMLKE